ncbi:MAG: class I SAM-dependent methyltransferase, partial [Alphaproteobacteria bacterium]
VERVLDLACGTGYGTAVLAERAAEVIGGDVDVEAIESIDSSFPENPQVRFEVMDGTKLPFSDARFDVVVSFETIEHTRDYEAMLDEFRRVIKPGGLFFVSTPNRLVQSPDGIIHNPFHTQEFTPDEFRALLDKRFASVKVYGQEYVRYKDRSGLRWTVAAMLEKLQYRRGVRKMPLSIQNTFMRLLIAKGQYPDVEDYRMNDDPRVLRESCITQFAICRP